MCTKLSEFVKSQSTDEIYLFVGSVLDSNVFKVDYYFLK